MSDTTEYINTSDSESTDDSVCNLESNNGKKRVKNQKKWKRNVRKKNRATGEGYEATNGNFQPGKVFSPTSVCCSKKCAAKIEINDQNQLFDYFHNFEEKERQDIFLMSCLEKFVKLTESVGNDKIRRENQWKYFLTVQSLKIPVCRKLLLSILQISEKRLRTVQRFKLTGEEIKDGRGKHDNRPNKISEDVYAMIQEHWATFPSENSHYGRANNRKYFENPDLNVQKLYISFKEYYFNQKKSTLEMSYNTYHRYFRENSIYSFRQPRTDVCDFCTECKIKLKVNAEDPCKHQYLIHQEKTRVYNFEKKKYLDDLKNDLAKDVLIIEFDYAQNLPLPKLNVTSQFYKRLLWLYNFNVHCHNDGSSSFYCFLETEAKKDSNTVCSFLYHFIKKKLEDFPTIKKIVFYSDSCGGQNKNINVVMFCTWLASSLNIIIEHIFPVRGHSYNQCDRNFGKYSKILKNHETVENVDEYFHVMSSARKNPSPFNVINASSLIEDWSSGLQKFISKVPTSKTTKTRFSIQQYVKLSYDSHGTITSSKSYTSTDCKFTFEKNKLPKDKLKLSLQLVKPSGVKDAKRTDVLSLTPYMKKENAEWLKRVLIQEGNSSLNQEVSRKPRGRPPKKIQNIVEEDDSDHSQDSNVSEEY
ncbi:uncharacterized protein LOC122507356 [Leptopilina heterotoma]|uniref:uncharacterized protein LOC122499684 n=1 Tax=Leptopilina heterotoma TaxID=63436 RepID=UPI001CAA316D|nr:uncharacterized protein LOC122499684 [Leptopilina heterotoma]XP_043475951.1 uncharacterized protein LOC122507356 [Leptopilina heterotoma]